VDTPIVIMNKIIIILIVIIFLSCEFKRDRKSQPKTKIQYLDTFYNLGNCNEGDTLHFTVRYKNEGNNPLFINFSQGSCSCTQPHFSKTPLEPNKIGSIYVDFYTKGQKGKYYGTVAVGANTNPFITQIYFIANVINKN